MLENIKKIHLVGIGGIGMSGIAEILFKKGYKISGSDKSLNEVTGRLVKLGIKIYEDHSAENIKGDIDALIYTSAVSMNNPEIDEAIKKHIPIIKRSEMLAELMRNKYGICIAGTHGKTTTTSMIGLILQASSLDPTIIVGGILNELGGSNAWLGKSNYIVVEADEFDRTFLKLNPVLAVLTTLEAEHLDTYKDLQEIKSAFIEFANKIPYYGFAVVCEDEPNIKDILPFINRKVFTYGLRNGSNIRAVDIRHDHFSSEFNVIYFKENLGKIRLNIPGNHNVKNALAAIIIGRELGISFETIKKSLESFKGAVRRFEVKYNKEVLVIDDYAHHPTEVSATLAGIKNGWNRRLIAVFQPHLYSRTRDFAKDFGKAFLKSDVFICTDIYPAREEPIEGVTGELITNEAQRNGHQNVIYEEDKNKIPDLLSNFYREGDIIITLGAGDIYKQGDNFIQLLKNKSRVIFK
jgi:UDP-N-acetylmuramate--alanine ligase